MQDTQPTRARDLILLMRFLVSPLNYADRASLSAAGSRLQKALGMGVALPPAHV